MMEDMANSRKERLGIGTHIYLCVIILYLLFSSNSSIGNMLFFGVLSVMSAIMVLFNLGKWKIISNYVWYFIFSAVCILSLAVTSVNALGEGIKFCIGALGFGFVMLVVSNCNLQFIRRAIKIIFGILIVYLVATLLQMVVPQFVDKICQIVLSEESLEQNRKFLNAGSIYGGLPGLTSQIGTNSYYLAVFLGMCVIKLLFEKKTANKLLWIFLILLGFLGLVQTNKRGMLLFAGIMIVLIVAMYNKKNFVKTCAFLTFVIIAGGIILLSTDVGQKMIQKFSAGGLSGREILWKNAWHAFLENPIMGMGIDSFQTRYGLDTHNIFLQILCETGLVGLGAFLIMVLLNLSMAMKTCLKSDIDEKLKSLSLFAFFVQGIFLLWGMSGNSLYDQYVFCWYLASVGVIININARRTNNENRNFNTSIF